ncbi:MAG: hypothetical protein JWP57_709 [Spirosoma sp.]|nr:hypothetical protein [Spirosoma sp.]
MNHQRFGRYVLFAWLLLGTITAFTQTVPVTGEKPAGLNLIGYPGNPLSRTFHFATTAPTGITAVVRDLATNALLPGRQPTVTVSGQDATIVFPLPASQLSWTGIHEISWNDKVRIAGRIDVNRQNVVGTISSQTITVGISNPVSITVSGGSGDLTGLQNQLALKASQSSLNDFIQAQAVANADLQNALASRLLTSTYLANVAAQSGTDAGQNTALAQRVVQVADIASLTTTTGSTNLSVQVRDPLRGGSFSYDATLTTYDYGITFPAANGGGFRRVYMGYANVRWWDAKGDGVTDDAPAINRATLYLKNQSGGTLFFPRSVYLAGSTIFHYRGIRLLGEGTFDNGGSRIKLKAGANCVLLKAGKAIQNIDTNDASFMALEKLVFDGNGLNQTVENEGIQFWGQYVGSEIRDVFMVGFFGHALSLQQGLDLKIDHLWVLGNQSSDGYGLVANQGLATGNDGYLNMNHVYVEFQVKSAAPVNVYASPVSARGTGMYLNRLITLNASELHFEYNANGMLLQNCFAANIGNIGVYDIGNGTDATPGVVQLYDENAARSLTIQKGFAGGTVSGAVKWVSILNGTSNTVMQGPLVSAATVLSGYNSAQTFSSPAPSAAYAPETVLANRLRIARVGSYSPQSVDFLASDGTFSAGMHSHDFDFRIGSARYQTNNTFKDFITLNSFGGNSDNLTLGVPLYLYNRTVTNNLNANALLLYNNVPSFFAGSAVQSIVTATSGTAAPTTTPGWVGQVYVNTANNDFYVAKGTASAASWQKLTPPTSNTSLTNDAKYVSANLSKGFLQIPQLTADNVLGVQRRNNADGVYVKNFWTNDTTGSVYAYLKMAGITTSIGSTQSQAGEKDFIAISSYGNNGDNITFSDPIVLANRAFPNNTAAGWMFRYNNVPSYAFGSNRIYNFPTVFSSTGAPTTTPDWIGQLYVNTATGALYVARGTASSADWVPAADVTSATSLTTGTLPDGRLSANVALLTGTQTLTGKTLTSPTITGGTLTGVSETSTTCTTCTLTGPTITGGSLSGATSLNLTGLTTTQVISGTPSGVNSLVQLTQSGLGRALYIQRTVASASRPVMEVISNVTNGGQPTLKLQQDDVSQYALHVTNSGGVANFGVTGAGNFLAVSGTVGQLYGSGSAPSVSAGAGAGTGATVSVVGTATGGTITLTTGSSPAAGTLLSLTFASAYSTNAPAVVLSGGNGTSMPVYSLSEATTGFSVGTIATPNASTVYTYHYHVIGR